jgi:hypothetical protein
VSVKEWISDGDVVPLNEKIDECHMPNPQRECEFMISIELASKKANKRQYAPRKKKTCGTGVRP